MLQDLLAGNSDPAATPRLVAKVTELTGLDPKFVKESGGRLETQAFLREEFRETGKLGSRYDPNVTAYDPFPYNPTQETNDPILLSIIAPTTTAMVDFVTRTVGWKTDARYNALSSEVNQNWDRGGRNGAFLGFGFGDRSSRSCCDGSQAARGDCAWMGGSFLPVHGVGADGEPDSDYGRSDADTGA